jgi:hypothetical protein
MEAKLHILLSIVNSAPLEECMLTIRQYAGCG